jgi:hypothetical protein
MILMVLLFWFLLYVVLAAGFIWFVCRATPKKIYRRLTVVLLLIFPAWDVLLGHIVYPPACRFISKTAIYETAETDGIYYEGDYNNYLLDMSEREHKIVTFADADFKRGYKYVESLVTERSSDLKLGPLGEPMDPTIYRCEAIPFNPRYPYRTPIDCVPAGKAESSYKVETKKLKFGITEVRFVKVINRSTGYLMAEHREVVIRDRALPIFHFMDWAEGGSSGSSCPAVSRYYDFHYDVLKANKLLKGGNDDAS